MSRRVSLPTADDLFRPTSPPEDPAPGARRASEQPPETDAPAQREAGPGQDASAAAKPAAGRTQAARGSEAGRRPSGRVRHDEKMTVYVTAEELLELEHARLTLRRETGLAVDRGRLVREAVAIALADLDANGEDSLIVQRLKQS